MASHSSSSGFGTGSRGGHSSKTSSDSFSFDMSSFSEALDDFVPTPLPPISSMMEPAIVSTTPMHVSLPPMRVHPTPHYYNQQQGEMDHSMSAPVHFPKTLSQMSTQYLPKLKTKKSKKRKKKHVVKGTGLLQSLAPGMMSTAKVHKVGGSSLRSDLLLGAQRRIEEKEMERGKQRDIESFPLSAPLGSVMCGKTASIPQMSLGRGKAPKYVRLSSGSSKNGVAATGCRPESCSGSSERQRQCSLKLHLTSSSSSHVYRDDSVLLSMEWTEEGSDEKKSTTKSSTETSSAKTDGSKSHGRGQRTRFSSLTAMEVLKKSKLTDTPQNIANAAMDAWSEPLTDETSNWLAHAVKISWTGFSLSVGPAFLYATFPILVAFLSHRCSLYKVAGFVLAMAVNNFCFQLVTSSLNSVLCVLVHGALVCNGSDVATVFLQHAIGCALFVSTPLMCVLVMAWVWILKWPLSSTLDNDTRLEVVKWLHWSLLAIVPLCLSRVLNTFSSLIIGKEAFYLSVLAPFGAFHFSVLIMCLTLFCKSLNTVDTAIVAWQIFCWSLFLCHLLTFCMRQTLRSSLCESPWRVRNLLPWKFGLKSFIQMAKVNIMVGGSVLDKFTGVLLFSCLLSTRRNVHMVGTAVVAMVIALNHCFAQPYEYIARYYVSRGLATRKLGYLREGLRVTFAHAMVSGLIGVAVVSLFASKIDSVLEIHKHVDIRPNLPLIAAAQLLDFLLLPVSGALCSMTKHVSTTIATIKSLAFLNGIVIALVLCYTMTAPRLFLVGVIAYRGVALIGCLVYAALVLNLSKVDVHYQSELPKRKERIATFATKVQTIRSSHEWDLRFEDERIAATFCRMGCCSLVCSKKVEGSSEIGSNCVPSQSTLSSSDPYATRWDDPSFTETSEGLWTLLAPKRSMATTTRRDEHMNYLCVTSSAIHDMLPD